jgi:uncharacterized protein with GYD domain
LVFVKEELETRIPRQKYHSSERIRDEKTLSLSSRMIAHAPKGERVRAMHFIALVKFRKKQTKAVVAENLKKVEEDTKEGVKWLGIYWTLGRYDAVALYEAPSEQAAMKMAIRRGENMAIETMVAVPVEEARKLVE